jgi:pimeloyl-ACP methyl ester carboxylesterase
MDAQRYVISIPGRIGGPYTPLLMFACYAAERRGAEVRHVWYSDAGDPLELPPQQRAEWVNGHVRPVLEGLGRPLLVAKSLGTNAAALAADLDLPAVWITPLIGPGQWYGDLVTAALRAATAPFLLIGGTADLSWDGELARELTPHVFEVAGAGHGLTVAGPLASSAAVLGEMATAVERFLDEVVWPS